MNKTKNAIIIIATIIMIIVGFWFIITSNNFMPPAQTHYNLPSPPSENDSDWYNPEYGYLPKNYSCPLPYPYWERDVP